MVSFHFRAVTHGGQPATGRLDAPTAEQARRILLKSYSKVLSVTAIRAGGPRPLPRGRVSADDLALFFRRFATLLASGVTIDAALDNLSRSDEGNGALGAVVDRLLHGVLSGRTLSQSMSDPDLKGLFSELSIGMIAVGERTGGLTESALRLADLSERQFRLRRAILSALAYPAVLLGVITAVGALFVLVIAPSDKGLFSTFGGKLPWPSQVLVNMSDFLRSPWAWVSLLLGVPLLFAAARELLRRSPPVRRALDTWIWNAPLVGVVVRKSLSARVVAVLGASLRVGIPALEALSLARQVAFNKVLEQGMARATERFRDGTDLASALEAQNIFPRVVTALMAVGQETGTLDTLLHRACVLFEEDVESALTRFSKLIEPLLLALAGAAATFVALATLLPVMEIAGHI